MTPLRAAMLMLFCSLLGCSQQNSGAAPAAAATVAPRGQTDDPCVLVDDSEVGNAFVGAGASKRDHSLDQYGIATCTWDSPTNKIVVQIFTTKGSAQEEVRSRMAGYIDPVRPGAGDKVQYVMMAGLGDEATVSAVKADDAKGILTDGAVLSIRHGERMAVLLAQNLIDGDTAATIKALQALGISASTRL